MNPKRHTFLVTGAMGCIGAWTLYHLVNQRHRVVSFDISTDRHRLDLLLAPAEQEAVTFVRGDVTDSEQVSAALRTHRVTHVIHLAALQVPFCKANPVLGARVNVAGTVNVFEGARQADIKHVAYASSIAVYGPAGNYPPGPIAHDALPAPETLYGVYKVANENTARVYGKDYRMSSTGLRAYTVYGVGRDQGLTSDPTKAMRAAAEDKPFEISFGGTMQFHLASDVALQFVDAATHPLQGAHAFNLGTGPATVAEVIALIKAVKPDAEITCTDTPLPFPERFDDAMLRRHVPRVYETPLADGIRQTIRHFEARLHQGRPV